MEAHLQNKTACESSLKMIFFSRTEILFSFNFTERNFYENTSENILMVQNYWMRIMKKPRSLGLSELERKGIKINDRTRNHY